MTGRRVIRVTCYVDDTKSDSWPPFFLTGGVVGPWVPKLEVPPILPHLPVYRWGTDFHQSRGRGEHSHWNA